MTVVLWTLIGFAAGAVPFSLLVGKFWLNQDIRRVGDGNPGATNVLRGGGWAPFIVALMLDISKGAAPVGMAYYVLGIQDWRIVPISIAPVLGHTFSPFLNWRGGKAIAAAFGVWIGVTLWTMPLVALSLLIFWSLLIRPSGWAVMLSLAGMLLTLLLWINEPPLVGVWAAQTALLAWNHRHELTTWPQRKRRPT